MTDNKPMEAGSPSPGGSSGELKRRVISGVVLAAVAVGLAYAGSILFALLVMAVGILMSWEWGRVVRSSEFDIVFAVHAAAVIAAVLLTAFGMAALGVAALVVGAIVVIPLAFGSTVRLSALGVLYTGLPAVALLWIRGAPSYGFAAIFFICLIVAASDTAAFAVGRTVGGPKLWPSVSPNKTWSGLIGGVTAGAIVGGLYGGALGGPPIVWLAVTGAVLSCVAQGGDLAESALKRGFGVKDTSGLIPGHGGFMDRMDSIVTVAVAAALLGLIINPRSPAEALLFGW
jgi:phosphatidate cytidylyltransferase